MKRTGIQRKPAAVKAWQRRSQRTAAENAKGKPRAPLKRTASPKPERVCPSCNSTVCTRRWCSVCGSDMVKNAPAKDPATLRPVVFRPPYPASQEECFHCSTTQRPVRAAHWHHWLPQRTIKAYVRSQRLSEQSSRALLNKLLADRRNIDPICKPCHDEHEHPGVGSRRLSGEEVPHRARIFALELGPEWAESLRRLYPGGQRERT